MMWLYAGLVLFFGSHLIPLLPVKQGLQQKLGEIKYRLLIAVPSLAGIILIVIGYRQSEIAALWYPINHGRELALGLMPVAFILFTGAHMKTNIRRFIKHPMLVGMLIWAGLHLLNNGELRAVILFGAFAIYSLLDLFFTSKPPRPATVYPIKNDIIVIVAGLFVYAVVLHIHAWAGVKLW